MMQTPLLPQPERQSGWQLPDGRFHLLRQKAHSLWKQIEAALVLHLLAAMRNQQVDFFLLTFGRASWCGVRGGSL